MFVTGVERHGGVDTYYPRMEENITFNLDMGAEGRNYSSWHPHRVCREHRQLDGKQPTSAVMFEANLSQLLCAAGFRMQ